jgi:hypothetical protein
VEQIFDGDAPTGQTLAVMLVEGIVQHRPVVGDPVV